MPDAEVEGRSRDGAAPTAHEFALVVRLARCAALADGAGALSAFDELDAPVASTAATLQRHQVGELVVHAIRGHQPDSPVATEVADALEGVRWSPPVPAHIFLDSFDELQGAFAAAGIPVLLLKGAVLAQRLYGGVDRRPQYDLDVLVRRAHTRQAVRVMRGVGYTRVRRYQHAASLRRRPVEVDLHWALRSAPAYAIDDQRVWDEAVPVTFGDVNARTLSDDHLLLLMACSVAEDNGRGVAKLKQLCDLWLLVRELDEVFDWDAWLAACRSERVAPVAASGLALTVAVLQADENDAPRLAQALSASGMQTVGARDRALALLASREGALANATWFESVYPGSALLYRTHSFIAGLPASIRDVRPGRYVPFRRRR